MLIKKIFLNIKMKSIKKNKVRSRKNKARSRKIKNVKYDGAVDSPTPGAGPTIEQEADRLVIDELAQLNAAVYNQITTVANFANIIKDVLSNNKNLFIIHSIQGPITGYYKITNVENLFFGLSTEKCLIKLSIDNRIGFKFCDTFYVSLANGNHVIRRRI